MEYPEFFAFVAGETGGMAFRVVQFRRVENAVLLFDRQGKQRGKLPVKELLQMVENDFQGLARLEIVLSPALNAAADDAGQSQLVADTGDKKLVLDFICGKSDRTRFVKQLEDFVGASSSRKGSEPEHASPGAAPAQAPRLSLASAVMSVRQ